MATLTVNDIFKAALAGKTIRVRHSRGETTPFQVERVGVDLDDTLVFHPTEGSPRTFGPLYSLTFIEEPPGGTRTGVAGKPEKKKEK